MNISQGRSAQRRRRRGTSATFGSSEAVAPVSKMPGKTRGGPGLGREMCLEGAAFLLPPAGGSQIGKETHCAKGVSPILALGVEVSGWQACSPGQLFEIGNHVSLPATLLTPKPWTEFVPCMKCAAFHPGRIEPIAPRTQFHFYTINERLPAFPQMTLVDVRVLATSLCAREANLNERTNQGC